MAVHAATTFHRTGMPGIKTDRYVGKALDIKSLCGKSISAVLVGTFDIITAEFTVEYTPVRLARSTARNSVVSINGCGYPYWRILSGTIGIC